MTAVLIKLYHLQGMNDMAALSIATVHVLVYVHTASFKDAHSAFKRNNTIYTYV